MQEVGLSPVGSQTTLSRGGNDTRHRQPTDLPMCVLAAVATTEKKELNTARRALARCVATVEQHQIHRKFGDSDKSLPAQGLADARIGCRPTHDTPHYMQEVRLTVQRMRMELNGSTPGF
ncbi:hypothetical protein EAH_00021780 [Eimeria acervulina]|uniref:Uncharacterized protein n=1 Tax=Eimeria acervulina TaxID=5801 RepID=U6GAE8_EIMAC|nr:hypothetical protein EAH_00021780 [Eimeria acervulina]CDI77095.1 hypothetical protein EAH_00021780 [Eimeria acervulina]